MADRKLLIKLIIYISLILAVVAIPFAGIYVYATSLPATYKESYYAALPLKYDRLYDVKGEKIIVIGGSSVAFGIDSKLVEQELGMPCVNFGLYAAFGLKPMLDLSEGAVGEGDIVIIAPELSTQMYSDYVGYDYLLQACEQRSDMAFDLGLTYAAGFLSKFPSYIKDAGKLEKLGGLKVKGIYAAGSFDEYGDIVYERDVNVMDGMYSADNLPEIKESMISDEFAKMGNDYARKAENKGAKVYFGFCPVNELSAADISSEDRKAFVEKLDESLDVEIIASLEDHIFEAGYFYDSNFHTNDAGTVLNTVLLINDIKRVTLEKMTATNIEIPKAPAATTEDEAIASGTWEGFKYVVTSSGVTITGLSQEGLELEKLEIPSQIENYVVIKIDDKAFAGCCAKEIVLPESITVLSAGIFSEANELAKVVLQSKTLPEVGNSLLNGANSDVKIYVPEELYSIYVTDYFWGAYADRLKSYGDN